MWQKPHERVQTSPRIISVAVPAAQHSPMFGHLADWQTVCNFWSLTRLNSFAYASPPGIFILSHEGFRPGPGCAGDGAGSGWPVRMRWSREIVMGSVGILGIRR